MKFSSTNDVDITTIMVNSILAHHEVPDDEELGFVNAAGYEIDSDYSMFRYVIVAERNAPQVIWLVRQDSDLLCGVRCISPREKYQIFWNEPAPPPRTKAEQIDE